ncbi:MAG: transposase, partial [Burkholderiales bacterium]
MTRFSDQAPTWSKPRWVIGIRQHIAQRPAAKGKTLTLFAADPVIGQWRFSALVTDLDLPAEVIWRLYRGRADCENRIKELKYDFAADSFNLQDFWATEATLNTVMLAYNLMSLLRQVLLKTSAVKHSSKSVQHTLQTLRCW